jgi:hypothetical protein
MMPNQLSKDFIELPPPTPFLTLCVCARVYEEHLDQFSFLKSIHFRFLSINNIYRDFINIIEIIHLCD